MFWEKQATLCYFSRWGQAPDLGLTNHYYYYSLHCCLHCHSCSGITITTELKHNCQQQCWCNVQWKDHRKSEKNKSFYITPSYNHSVFSNLSFLQSACFSSLDITSFKSNISTQPGTASRLRHVFLRLASFHNIYLSYQLFFHLSSLRGNVRQLIKQLFLCASSLREIYDVIPQLITEQLFNAPRCSHLIPWKDPDTLVIRICRGMPNHRSEDMPVMKRFDFWTFCWKDTYSTAEGIKTKKDTPRGKVFKQMGLSLCVCVCVECFSQFSSLTGIFMVKPITKGNLSPNTTPQETVKIKHGGPGETLSVFR